MATATNDKPLRLGDLPIVKTNILENARQYDKGVIGGYNGTFPLTAASKGGIYLLPQTGKFYVCEAAYNGTQLTAPNSNFVELSVWKNSDRLNNLPAFDCGAKFTNAPKVGTVILINFNNQFKQLPIVVCSDGYTNSEQKIIVNMYITEITTSYFKIVITSNAENHSPIFYWMAINK